MFCPQCGQQQVSNEVRFCSRCGFQLAAVTGLLASGGALPVGGAQGGEPPPTTPRRKGVRQGGQRLLFGIFLMPVLAIMHELFRTPEELPLIGVLVFFAGLLRLIYALIFEEGPLRRQKTLPHFQYAPPLAPGQLPQRDAAGLPPAQASSAQSYVPPRGTNTAETPYRPPSVTEGTTRLLDDQRDAPGR